MPIYRIISYRADQYRKCWYVAISIFDNIQKGRPFWRWEVCSCEIWGRFTQNTPKLWNWGHFFRFRQQNLCETPNSGEIIMTSFPVGTKTSLSRKPCIPDKKLLWNAIRIKSWSLFQNPSWKSPEAPPGGEITMTSYPVWNKASLSRKPCIPDKKLLWNAISKSWSVFPNSSWKIAWDESHALGLGWA